MSIAFDLQLLFFKFDVWCKICKLDNNATTYLKIIYFYSLRINYYTVPYCPKWSFSLSLHFYLRRIYLAYTLLFDSVFCPTFWPRPPNFSLAMPCFPSPTACLRLRAVASFTAPGGQEFHFPHFSSNFDQFFLFFLKLYLSTSSFWPSGWASRLPGKALATPLLRLRLFLILFVFLSAEIITNKTFKEEIRNNCSSTVQIIYVLETGSRDETIKKSYTLICQ